MKVAQIRILKIRFCVICAVRTVEADLSQMLVKTNLP